MKNCLHPIRPEGWRGGGGGGGGGGGVGFLANLSRMERDFLLKFWDFPSMYK